MKLLMTTMKRDNMNIGAAGDNPFPILQSQAVSPSSPLVFMLLKPSIASSTPSSVFVVHVSLAVGHSLSSATATTQHHQQQEEQP